MSSMAANWFIKLPAAWLLSLPLGLGYVGVWWAITISIIAEVMILASYYRQGGWAKKEVRVGSHGN